VASTDVEAVFLPAYASEFYKLTEAERRDNVIRRGSCFSFSALFTPIQGKEKRRLMHDA